MGMLVAMKMKVLQAQEFFESLVIVSVMLVTFWLLN
jgi:hypothetical protein